MKIVLVGDYNPALVVAHACIPKALSLSCELLGKDVQWEWVNTMDIQNPEQDLSNFSSIWLTPGSPYKRMQGALDAARFARESGRPFLGTCGGFQHAVIEFARTAMNNLDADHAETNPEGSNLVVLPLSCSLVDKTEHIVFTQGSRLFSIFKGQPSIEGFHCNYGVNSEWKVRLESHGLVFTGFDENGEIRAFELPTHPFYVGTLFQPERYALVNKAHPIITEFLK